MVSNILRRFVNDDPIGLGHDLIERYSSPTQFIVRDFSAQLPSIKKSTTPCWINRRKFSLLHSFWWLSLIVGARTQQTNAFPASIDLLTLDGTNGFSLVGEVEADNCGISVSSAGDVNGDGIVDMVIGAPYANAQGKGNAGKSYIIFGSRNFGGERILALSSINGSNGFIINGEAVGDQSGTSVSSAGDVNGDGISDFVVGAPRADLPGRTNAGKGYVVFGSRDVVSGGSFQLSSIDGSNGGILNGDLINDHSSISVSSAGDVNGDGIDDLVIGADFANPSGISNAGKSYVLFGNRNFASGGSLELSRLNSSDGLVINGEAKGDQSGISVSSAGDVNGDGIADLVIGAYMATPLGKSEAGKSYVVFGSRSLGSIGSLELSSLNGSNGFILNGEAVNDRSGRAVSSAGDVNGDGIDDLLIGTSKADTLSNSKAGKVYVVFGSSKLGIGGTLELSSINGSNGFVLLGERADDEFGHSVSSAGDVNGDGIKDIIIGAYKADYLDRINSGKSYVVFGSRKIIRGGILELSSLNSSVGFALYGEATSDWSGISVSSAGDVNGDGIDDIVIGAQLADSTGEANSGKAYLIFGRSQTRRTLSELPTVIMDSQQFSTTTASQTLFSSRSNPFSSPSIVKTSSEKTTSSILGLDKTNSVSHKFIPQVTVSTLESFDGALIIGLGVGGGVIALSCSLLVLCFFVSKNKNANGGNRSDMLSNEPMYNKALHRDDEGDDSQQKSNYGVMPLRQLTNEYVIGDVVKQHADQP